MPAKKLIFIFLTFFLLIPLSGESAEKEWNCHLLTIGPGNPMYIWFGHTGLILENTHTGRSLFYDFGNFSFQSDHFYRNFAMGRLIYSSVGVSARAYLNYIVRENRDVTLQTLNLSQESIRKMAEYLNWKVQPGNNTYLYHHYLDNCSTRIRDLIDKAAGGQLKEATDRSAGTSFRNSFRRYSSHSWGADWLLSFLQGRTIDRDITYWDTMFLPDELMRQVDLLEIETPRGREPLVLKKEILVRAEGRKAIPDIPPSNTAQALIYGLIAGALLLVLQWGALSRRNGLRRLCRIILTILLLILSITGGLLYFLSLFTNHQVASENLNMLVIHPFYLLLIFLYLRKNNRSRIRVIERFWQIQMGALGLMFLINLLPGFHQGNERTLVLFLPLLMMQALLLPRLNRRTTGAGLSSGLLNRASGMQPGPDGQDGP